MRDTSATQPTRMQHKCDTSNTSEKQATRVQHQCNTSATRKTWERQECYTKDTSAARVKNFDFDSDMSKNIFLHPHIYYMTSERPQEEKQFHYMN